jgi:hypothetical protein
MKRTPWPLAALAMIAVVAGCGSGSASTSGGGNSTATASVGSGSSAASGVATIRAKAVKFAECMRNNGINGFPDPNASGELTIENVVNGTSIDTNSATWNQALSTCRNLEPAGFTGHHRNAQQQRGALAFAQCIRANGVPDFPDPSPDQPMIDTRRIPSTNQPGGMSALHAAMARCRGDAAAAGVTGGQ